MRKLHPCQGIRFADSLRSGDMRKVPRKVPRSPVTFIQAYTVKHIQKGPTLLSFYSLHKFHSCHSNIIGLPHHVVGSSPFTRQPFASLRACVVSAVGVMEYMPFAFPAGTLGASPRKRTVLTEGTDPCLLTQCGQHDKPPLYPLKNRRDEHGVHLRHGAVLASEVFQ